MKGFYINKKDRFIIYGAAYIGRDSLNRLRKLGYAVDAFLDKRASKIVEVDGVAVIHPDAYKCDKENVVVMIATGNPNSVANYLFELGYRKIIYNTFSNGIDSDSVMKMTSIYDDFMRGADFETEIPFYDRTIMDRRFCNSALVTQEEDHVTAFLTTDLMFVKDGEKLKHIYCKYGKLLRYLKAYDSNLDSLADTIYALNDELAIEFMMGSDIQLTFEERRVFVQTQLNILNMRLNYGMKWFIKNPISATIGSNNNCFIVEEKDVFRIMFLLAKGLQRIPVRMSTNEYECWINEVCLKEAIDYSLAHDLLTSYTLLEHPNFYNFPAARDIGGNARVPKICAFLEEKGIEITGTKVLDIGSYYGFLSRFFYRMGAEVTAVEYDENTYGLGVCLNRLLHCASIESICGGAQDLKREAEYDITVMLTVLYWHLDNGIGEKLIGAVDSMTKKMLIWESGDEPEREKEFIRKHSSFNSYEKIAETVGTGKVREMGIWYK